MNEQANRSQKIDGEFRLKPGACAHENFVAGVEINRLVDVRAFLADIRVRCADCGLPFEFIGVAPGLSFEGPRCDVKAQVLRIPVRPKGSKLLPGIPGFDMRVH